MLVFSSSFCCHDYSDNYLQVVVYFEEFNFQTVTQRPALEVNYTTICMRAYVRVCVRVYT